MPPQRAIEMEELSQYFKMPEKAVAKHLGICLTSLKKICRQNGIHRWPYRKIKSLDKKLKKLENAMVNAKDDPSMAHAVSGYSVPGDYSEFLEADSGTSSPTHSSEASVATTPRQHEWSGASSPQPDLDLASCLDEIVPVKAEPVAPVAPVAPAVKSLPVSFSSPVEGQPIKLELSLTPEMLKQMADGSKNITFVLQGANGETQLSVNSVNTTARSQLTAVREPEALCPVQEEPKSAVAVKEEELDGMTDEDIIAMLADCASTPAPAAVKPESFAQVIADSAAASNNNNNNLEMSAAAKVACLEPSDAELMAALAGCCGGNSPFDQDFGGHDEQGGEDNHSFYGGEEDMMGFESTWVEDFHGMHA